MTFQSASQVSESKRAIILAGGQGTRLKPYTTLFPKALVPLDEMPVLELVVRQLKSHGFTEITLAVGHLSELIEAYFGNGHKWDVSITYVREEKPLGTAGPLKTLMDLPENFLVMNADIVSDLNYRELFDFHCQSQEKQSNNLATIAVYRRTSKIDFGVLEFDSGTHQIQNFIEKPMLEHSVSMGIYIFNRRVCEFIPPDTFFGFDALMKTLIREKQPIQAYPFNGYWLDIGRVDDYETAVTDFKTMRDTLLTAPEVLKP
jgi:NDP-mannose synthase